MRLLTLGYYGFGNFGDELILAALQEELSGLDCEVVFAVNNPAQYGPPLSSRHSWVDRHDRGALLRALSGADAVLLGGGGLVQDVTSGRSSLYYLGIPFLGSLRHKKSAAYAQGVGPLTRRWSRQVARMVFLHMGLIDVRDQASRDLLVRCGIQNTRIHVSEDLALPYLLRHRHGGEPGRRAGIVACVNPRFGWNPEESALFLKALISRTGGPVSLVVLFPAADEQFSLAVREHLDPSCELIEAPTPETLLRLCSTASLTVAGRYHMAVAAIAARSPVVALAYDPKITQLSTTYRFPAVQPGTLPQQAAASLTDRRSCQAAEELLTRALQQQAERVTLLRTFLAG